MWGGVWAGGASAQKEGGGEGELREAGEGRGGGEGHAVVDAYTYSDIPHQHTTHHELPPAIQPVAHNITQRPCTTALYSPHFKLNAAACAPPPALHAFNVSWMPRPPLPKQPVAAAAKGGGRGVLELGGESMCDAAAWRRFKGCVRVHSRVASSASQAVRRKQ